MDKDNDLESKKEKFRPWCENFQGCCFSACRSGMCCMQFYEFFTLPLSQPLWEGETNKSGSLLTYGFGEFGLNESWYIRGTSIIWFLQKEGCLTIRREP